MSKIVKLNNDNYLDSGSITFKYIDAEAINFNGTTAGSSGYKQIQLNVPEGYSAICIGCCTARISDSKGLQCNVVYPSIASSGINTIYINYYAPQNITSDVYFTTTWLLLKTR